VSGILRLGRFLIWLAVFLFFYSSFLVLFQYGSANYTQKMLGGWSSITGEFEKSYRTLSATAPVSTPDTAGPAASPTAAGKTPASSASGGEEKKSGELPGYVAILIWGSVIICLLGFFWMVAVAFQESMLWGLGVLFIPPLAVVYWISHFREATPPLVLWVIGVVVQVIVTVHYGVDLQQYFLGAPPPPATPQPNPLEGMIVPLMWVLFR